MFRKSWDKEIGKRWVSSRISGLKKIGLIEMQPCRLTVSGLVYLILEKEIMYNDVINGILRYYSNNALFELFVSPYLKLDTLKELTSLNAFLPLSQFLYECCHELKDAVYEINVEKNKYLSEQVFGWQSVPKDKNATNVLRQFLKREFNLKWMDSAEFEKIGKGNKLRISYKNDSVLIELNYTKTEAHLTINGKVIHGFTVEARGEKNPHLIICFDRPISEQAANFLTVYTQSRVSSFVCNLILSTTSGSDDFRILSQDEIFMNTLQKTMKKINGQYELLSRMGGSIS